MPNGRPGDHPYFDVVKYDAAIFGDEIDALLREIHKQWGALDEVTNLAWDNNPQWGNVDFKPHAMLTELQGIKDRLDRRI